MRQIARVDRGWAYLSCGHLENYADVQSIGRFRFCAICKISGRRDSERRESRARRQRSRSEAHASDDRPFRPRRRNNSAPRRRPEPYVNRQKGQSEMGDYYDRQGRPIGLMEFARASKGDRRVLETVLPNGRWVSTVWLGFDHSFGGGTPLIFETMVFPGQGNFSDLDCERYATEADAIAGHQRMVEKWTADTPEEIAQGWQTTGRTA